MISHWSRSTELTMAASPRIRIIHASTGIGPVTYDHRLLAAGE
jgi:hypothetical protein